MDTHTIETKSAGATFTPRDAVGPPPPDAPPPAALLDAVDRFFLDFHTWKRPGPGIRATRPGLPLRAGLRVTVVLPSTGADQ